TKGWATKAVVGYEVISAFQHNAASTLEGRLGQEKEMKEHLANAFLIWGTGKMFGIGFSATGELAELASQRLNFAKKFYNEAGFSNKQFIKESGGIDLNEKVFETTLKKGTLLEQWAIKNPITGEIKMGNYYTFPGQDPTKLGVSLENRVKISITLSEDTKFLQSTTGNIPDWNGSGEVFKGGATQLFQTNVKYTLNEMPDSKLIRNYLKGN
ncbi:MAG: hypothetical protein JSS98_05775, partial [Bacteroidetes bacterium]|nr:hypothetical protein [Bacteroidota bacterium]